MRRYDHNGQLNLDELWWGYRLHWAGDKAPQPINATVEKLATSNYFRSAFAHHRCLIPEPARGDAKAIHPRMPLILDQQSLELWLDPELTDRETIRHLVHHLPHD